MLVSNMDRPTHTRIRRPRKDSQLKAAAILKAAKELFLRDGYSDTSMDAVALEAGVSKRTVYGHFGNKEDLFAEIIREMCSDVLPSDVARKDEDSHNVEEHLTRIGTVFLAAIYGEEQIRLFRTIVSDSRIYPEIGRMMYEGPVMASNRVVHAYLEKMVKKGVLALNDTELAAAQFLGMLKTDIHLRLLFNHRLVLSGSDIEALARKCARLFLHGALVPQR